MPRLTSFPVRSTLPPLEHPIGGRPRCRRQRPFLFLPLLALASLAACDEVPTHPAGAAPGALASSFYSSELLDPLIDPDDTYLITRSISTTVSTVTSAEPFVDPATGLQVTRLELPAIVDSSRAEGGYDAAGVVRLAEYSLHNDPGALAARVQVVGEQATFYDASGAVVHEASGPVLIDALGGLSDVVVTDETILHDVTVDGTADGEDESGSGAAVPEAAIAVGAPGSLAAALVAGTVVTERRGQSLFRTRKLDDSASRVRGERVQEFRMREGAWVLARERVITEASSGVMSTRTVETVEYPLVKWKNNSRRDRDRRERRSKQPAGSSPGVSSSMAPSVAMAEGLASFTALEPSTGEEGGDGGGTDSGGDDGSGGTTPTTSTAPDGLNIAFQHGGFADASVWSAMDPWVSGRFAIGTKVKPSLDSRARIESQASELNQRLLASGASNFLVVGHSNGGLVARRVGQNGSGASGSLVTGVVAIASPHKGVPLAHNSRQIVTDQLSSHFGGVITRAGGSCWRSQFNWICPMFNDALATLVPRVVNFAFDTYVPMAADVRPGSPFLAELNGRQEGFHKYSIEVHSRGAWKFMRMLGDWLCAPGERCDGNSLANGTTTAYDILRYCGSNFFGRIVAGSLADKCRNVRWAMADLNALYERLTAGTDPKSDGLIPGESQRYPGASDPNRRVLSQSPTSHAGELVNAGVRESLYHLIDIHKGST